MVKNQWMDLLGTDDDTGRQTVENTVDSYNESSGNRFFYWVIALRLVVIGEVVIRFYGRL